MMTQESKKPELFKYINVPTDLIHRLDEEILSPGRDLVHRWRGKRAQFTTYYLTQIIDAYIEHRGILDEFEIKLKTARALARANKNKDEPRARSTALMKVDSIAL